MSGFRNEYTLLVDIKKRLASPVPVFKRGDTAKLKFKIFDDGVLYDLTDFTSAEVSHILPSGTTLVGNALLDSATGLVTYDYVGAEMAEVGYVSTSLTIYSGTEQVSIQPFNVYMYDNMSDKDLSYIGILQDLIKETQILKAEVSEFLENAQLTMDEIDLIKTELETLNQSVTDAENARITNEANRQSAENIRDSNELGRIAEESIRVTSETARKNAETTRVNNENIRQSNESTRQTNETNRQTTFTNTINSVNDKLSEIEGFDFVGDYNASLVYEKLNVVKYNGSSFVALKQVTGITPIDDGINWKMVAQRGNDGDGGTTKSVNNILADVNGNITLTASDVDAYSKSEIDNKLADFVATPTIEIFTSTTNQSLFTLTLGEYELGKNQLRVIVGGSEQYVALGNFTETSTTSFTLSEPLPSEIKVVAIY